MAQSSAGEPRAGPPCCAGQCLPLPMENEREEEEST